MSALEWRFNDEHGVEQVLGTTELKAALASGRITPSTLVRHDGMKDWAPAFTVPELSGAAIAAGRRSVPPGRPASIPPLSRQPTIPPGARRPQPRAPMRTLVGLEPELISASLGLNGPPSEETNVDPPPSSEVPSIPGAPRVPDMAADAPPASVVPRRAAITSKTLVGGLSPRAPAALETAASTPRAPMRSKPPPPPRRGETPAPSAVAPVATTQPAGTPAPSVATPQTWVGAGTGAGTPAARRQRSVPPPPPRRGSGSMAATPAPPAVDPALEKTEPSGAQGARPAGAAPPPRPNDKTSMGLGRAVSEPDAPSPAEAPSTESATGAPSLRELKKTLEMEVDGDAAASRELPPDDGSDDEPTRQFQADQAVARAEGDLGFAPTDPNADATPPPASAAATSRSSAPPEADPPRRQSSAPPSRPVESSSVPPAPGRRARKEAVEIPMSSLAAASGVWIFGLVAFFFAGRCTGGDGGTAAEARDGLVHSFLFWQPPGLPMASTEPKPCWVTRQPTRWLAAASKSVPFELRPAGESMALGLAVGEHEAVGLLIDPRTGRFEEKLRAKVEGDIARVAPRSTPGEFYVSESDDGTVIPMLGPTPAYLVQTKTMIGTAEKPDASPTTIWTLEGDDEPSAQTVLHAKAGYFFTMRRGKDVTSGWFDDAGKALGELTTVPGSGGRGGKPRTAFNGKEVAITFADKPDADTPWQVRLGRAEPPKVPETTMVVSLPEGGPGGDAIAPDLVGLADGRWLLMWTEGSAGQRAIRAQTYDAAFTAVGDPIALSPPAGNFGQATLGVVGDYTTVVFLQKGEEDFELWGAVLRCGS